MRRHGTGQPTDNPDDTIRDNRETTSAVSSLDFADIAAPRSAGPWPPESKDRRGSRSESTAVGPSLPKYGAWLDSVRA